MKIQSHSFLSVRVVALLGALFAGSLWADNQFKQLPSDDTVYTYEDGENWSLGVPACDSSAGSSDGQYNCAAFNYFSAAQAAGTTRIKFTSDESLAIFRNFTSGIEGKPAIYDFDLGGNTVKVTWQQDSINLSANETCISKDDLGPAAATMVIRNGTLSLAGYLKLGASGLAGGFVVSEGGTLMNNGNLSYCAYPRLKVEAGGTFTSTGGFSQRDDLSDSLPTDLYGYICATGENAVATFGDSNFGGRHIRLYALDGGKVSVTAFTIGSNSRSEDVRVIVDGGTLEQRHWGMSLGSATEGCRDVRLIVGSDPRSLITTKQFSIYQGRNAKIEWTVPKDGWVDSVGSPRAPIQCETGGGLGDNSGKVMIVPLAEGLTDEGDLALNVSAREWMCNHLGETITLMTTQNSTSQSALEELSKIARVTDWSADEFVDEPTFSVSEDGLSLCLTAPTAIKHTAPTLSAASTEGTTTAGKRTLKVSVTDFGFCVPSLKTLTLTYATKGDFSDAVNTELDIAAVGTDLPLELTFEDVLPAYDAAKTYFCKVTAVNSVGLSASSAAFMEDAGTAEYFRWTQAKDGDFYDLSNWEMGSDGQTWSAATHFPRGEDTLVMPEESGAFTITADYDVEVKGISTWVANEGMLHHATFDMKGHKITFTGSVGGNDVVTACGKKTQALDLSLPTANYTFKNAVVDNQYLWFIQGSISWDAFPGGLAFTDGSSVIYQCLGFNNGSTLRVESGSTLSMTNTSVNFSTSRHRDSGYGYVLVKDAGSLLDATRAGFQFGISGRSMGLYVLDKGTFAADELVIGWGSAAWSGAPNTAEENNNCFAVVSNATMLVARLKLGQSTEAVDSPKLTLEGADSKVAVSDTFYNYQNTGAELVFNVPTNGWTSAPLTAKKLQSVARGSYTARAQTKLRVNFKSAIDTQGGNTVTLMTLQTANAAALQELADNVAYDRRPPTDAGVKVSDDGKSLLMTIPKRSGLAVVVH